MCRLHLPAIRQHLPASRTLIVAVGLLLWGAVGSGTFSARGQARTSAANALTSRERPVRIRLQPTYQRFEDEGRTLTQWSVPVVAVVPFLERWQVSIRGSGASATGDNLTTLSGLSDVRAALSYTWPVGDGSIIASASINAPVGKKELTQGEFDVARLLSRNFYPFRVPSFGQGLGAGTGVTWAVPVTESVVVGIGGLFRYHGSYSPTVDQQAEYDPGEEGRLTGGIDIRLSPASALSADVSYFLYGTDTVGGVDRFNVGNQISVRLQYLRKTERYTIRVVGRYQQREKSTLPPRTGADRTLQVLPAQGGVRGRYRIQLTDRVDLQVSAAGRWYEETSSFERKTLGTAGVEPRLEIVEGVVVVPSAEYTMGSITGIEGGIGLRARL
ncbi:MAG: hypothetical protein ABEL04_13245 [Salinibacter sp.]|uniref:hypothetical protein n=1 Tax=Salinibacter sp. TaxID=2065818 RepID=UPI0035D478E6